MRNVIFYFMTIDRPDFGSALWYGPDGDAVLEAYRKATGSTAAPLLGQVNNWEQFDGEVLPLFYELATDACSHDTFYVMPKGR